MLQSCMINLVFSFYVLLQPKFQQIYLVTQWTPVTEASVPQKCHTLCCLRTLMYCILSAWSAFLLPLLSSSPFPQLITTHQVSVLMFLLPRHLLWFLSLLIAVIRIEFLSYQLSFSVSPVLDNTGSTEQGLSFLACFSDAWYVVDMQ